jgi:hypothetical protein
MPFAVTAVELARGHVLPLSSAYTRARRRSYSTSASSAANASKRVRWRAPFFLNSHQAHPKLGILPTFPENRNRNGIIRIFNISMIFKIISIIEKEYRKWQKN